MKLLGILAIVFILYFAFSSFWQNNSRMETYSAVLNGSNEVPVNTSTATGKATLTLYKDTKVFKIDVMHTVVDATSGHIHKGSLGENGDIVFTFLSTESTINYTSRTLNDAQIADLRAGLYYVNIHSAAFPDGEIRGKLIKY